MNSPFQQEYLPTETNEEHLYDYVCSHESLDNLSTNGLDKVRKFIIKTQETQTIKAYSFLKKLLKMMQEMQFQEFKEYAHILTKELNKTYQDIQDVQKEFDNYHKFSQKDNRNKQKEKSYKYEPDEVLEQFQNIEQKILTRASQIKQLIKMLKEDQMINYIFQLIEVYKQVQTLSKQLGPVSQLYQQLYNQYERIKDFVENELKHKYQKKILEKQSWKCFIQARIFLLENNEKLNKVNESLRNMSLQCKLDNFMEIDLFDIKYIDQVFIDQYVQWKIKFFEYTQELGESKNVIVKLQKAVMDAAKDIQNLPMKKDNSEVVLLVDKIAKQNFGGSRKPSSQQTTRASNNNTTESFASVDY